MGVWARGARAGEAPGEGCLSGMDELCVSKAFTEWRLCGG